MTLFDYHLHSKYSMDSREELENICSKAVSCGMQEIAVTDHAEMQKPEELPDFIGRKRELDNLNQQYSGIINILSGVEIGQAHRFPEETGKMIRENEFDFVIGSLHETKDFGSPGSFLFDQDSVLPYLRQYFRELCLIAEKTDYDVLGHVTLPFRYVPAELYQTFSPAYFQNEYRNLFQTVIDRGKGIEVNASGFRTCLKEPMPSLRLLELYKNMGGKVITAGSDGHSARSACAFVPETFEVIKQAGFTQISAFSARTCRMVNI